MARRFIWTLAALAFLVGGERPARASFVINFSQSGSDVIANGSGSLDFRDLNSGGGASNPNTVIASSGAMLLGPVPANGHDIYFGSISGPSSFGPGGFFPATSGSSTAPGSTSVGINGTSSLLYVPQDYGAGDLFTVSSTWANTTFSGLGLTPGMYVWTWGTTHPDSLTVIIPGAVAVPEPASLTLVGLGVASLLICRSRKHAG